MKRSTGLRNYLLDNGSLKEALANTVIRIYSGTAPVTADESIGAATLLCTISVDGGGTGVTLESTANGGAITKNTSEVWTGLITTSGAATFFRMSSVGDVGALSTTAVRLQGTVALDGADMNLSTVNLVEGNMRQINYFVVSISAG